VTQLQIVEVYQVLNKHGPMLRPWAVPRTNQISDYLEPADTCIIFSFSTRQSNRFEENIMKYCKSILVGSTMRIYGYYVLNGGGSIICTILMLIVKLYCQQRLVSFICSVTNCPTSLFSYKLYNSCCYVASSLRWQDAKKLATWAGKMATHWTLRTTCCVMKENSILFPYNKSFID